MRNLLKLHFSCVYPLFDPFFSSLKFQNSKDAFLFFLNHFFVPFLCQMGSFGNICMTLAMPYRFINCLKLKIDSIETPIHKPITMFTTMG